ncbi:MAG: hypothetical protein JW966_05670 [Anaerolineae bacterium]|nr:hypothetical protein [Anaerolineae bacterium]
MIITIKHAAGRAVFAVLVVVLLLALSACGGDTGGEESQVLSAPPTRTPTPVGAPTGVGVSASVDSNALPDGLAVVALDDTINGFLTAVEAGEIDVMDQGLIFTQMLIDSDRSCFGDTTWANRRFELFFDMTGITLPVLDISAWRDAVARFPKDDLAALIRTTWDDAAALAPVNAGAAANITVCTIPVPHMDLPEELPASTWESPYTVVYDDAKVLTFDGDTLLVMCAGGEACMDGMQRELAHAFGLAYQLRLSGFSLDDLDVFARLIFEARSGLFARLVYPDLPSKWPDGLAPEDEKKFWRVLLARMQFDGVPTETSMQLFYGYYGVEYFPPWGGMIVASGMVDDYQQQHSDLAWVELAALPPDVLFDMTRGDAFVDVSG